MEKDKNIYFTKLTTRASTPKRATELSAGFDLHSADIYNIPARGKCLCRTDLVIAIPYGYYGRIAPRSGLANNNFIDVGAGVIDSDYRGQIYILLFNFSNDDYTVNENDRIAQIIIEKINTNIIMINTDDMLAADLIVPADVMINGFPTNRGCNGFGSTGK